MLLFFLFITIYNLFFNTQCIKGEEVVGVYPSPSGRYLVTVYLNRGGNITVDSAILARVKNTRTRLSKNIYWAYHCRTADIRWLDETTVVINNVTLNIKTNVYDWRRH